MAGRVISIALVATDRMSRAFREAGDSADRLGGGLDGISRRGADISDAVSGLVRAGAAISAIPASGPIVAGIGAMAPAFAAAGAGAGAMAAVAIPAINRIKTAMEAQTKAEGAAAKNAAAAQSQAYARANAQQALASAIRNAAYSHRQALEQVRQAEMNLADSQKDAKEAQLELNDARDQAKAGAEDLKNRVASTQLSVQQSTLDVADAQREYNELLKDPEATDSQIARAKLGIAQAKQNLKEQELMLKRLREEEKKAAKEGVEGSDAVKSARERLADANRKIAESERALAKARENVTRVDQQSADSIASARRALAQANASAASSTSELGDAMAELSPSARDLMGKWQGLSKAFDTWQRSMEPKVLPLLGRGVDLLKSQLPSLTPIVKGASQAVGGLLTRIEKGAKGKQFAEFKKQFTELVPVSMSGLGNSLINVLKGIMGIFQAFMPKSPAMIKGVEQLTARFAEWGTTLGQNQNFKAFMDWATSFAATMKANGPMLSQMLSDIGAAFINVGSALVPLSGTLGGGFLSSVSLIAQAIAQMDPETIRALAIAFVAYKTAMTAATIASTGFAAASAAVGGVKAVASGIGAATTAASGFVAGFRNVNLAYRDGATRATILGAAIKSQILAWRQSATAALTNARANTTAALSAARARVATIANTVAQRASAAASKAWAAAQWVLNAALAGNPLVWIVIAIAALVAAIVIAYKKSETFRAVVQAAWEGIKSAAAVAWGFLKQVFAAIWSWITTTLVPVFKQMWEVAKAVWSGIVSAVQAAWPVIQSIFKVIWNVIKGVLMVAWKILFNYVKIVWIGIQIYIKVAWAIIKAVFTAISAVIRNVVAPIFRWLYDKIIKPVWGKIKDAIRQNWVTIKFIFNAIKNFVTGPLAEAFRKFRAGAKIVWDGLKTIISAVWERSLKPIFQRLREAVGKVKDAFGTAVDGIKKVWGKIQDIAKKPVNFVIGVYNRGVVNLVNKIADFAGIKTRLNPIPALADGGVLPGYAPGRDKLIAAVSPGESVFRPEFTRAVGSSWVSRANQVARMQGPVGVRKWLSNGGAPLGAEGGTFSRGGTVGGYAGAFGLGGIVGDFMGGLKDFAFGDVDKAASKVLSKIMGTVPGDGLFRDVVAGIPVKIKDAVLSWIKGKVGSGVGGPGMSKALTWAKSQDPKPYIWGATGPEGYDCSGFMGAITNVINGKSPYSRLFSTFSFTGQQGPAGFQRGVNSGFKVGITNAGKGHMAGTLLNTNVESRSSAGVVVGPQARGFNDGLFDSWYGLKADTGNLALQPGWNPPTYNGTGRTEFLSVEGAGGSAPIVFNNHGVIGSQAEMDRWLSTSMERLRRRKKLPSAK